MYTKTVIIVLLILGLVFSTGCTSPAKSPVSQEPVKAVPPVTGNISPVETADTYRESYTDWKLRNRQYNVSEWHTWHLDNVSGSDMTVHVTMYRYRFEPDFQAHSVSWGTDAYFRHAPDEGNTWLFIWVCMYMDGSGASEDTRIWGMGANHFCVRIGDKTYQPITNEIDLTQDIKEFKDTYDLGSVARTLPYGYFVLNQGGKETAIVQGWLHMGRSNAWDGWILYEVPKDTDPDTIIVLGGFDRLGGDAKWTFKPGGWYDGLY